MPSSRGGYIVVRERCMTVVLLHMGSTILVESEVLKVTAVVHCFKGHEDFVVHGGDLVSPKEMGVKSVIHLASILGCREFLHMLPCAGGREQRVEDGPNRLRVCEKGRNKGSSNLEFIVG